jgi:hypothetical protein
MRAHVIENDVVVNTIEVDSLDFTAGLVEATNGGIGWTYVNGEFVDLRPAPDLAPVPLPPSKEQLLTQLQALQAQIEVLGE